MLSKKELVRRMQDLGIREQDLQEAFVRSSGPGGQNVNKVATCVVLQHIPTGIQIKCQSERSQQLNRHQARCLLVAKIGRIRAEERLKRIQEKQREKRRRRKRPEALKEKILEGKRRQAEKKSGRRKIDTRNWEKDA